MDGVSDDVIDDQREALAAAYEAEPFGPQAPRDIEEFGGVNPVTFDEAPPYTEMNLCNIHFHEGAEHKGGEFTTYIGNGDGEGNGTGYAYDGDLTDDELAPYDGEVGATDKVSLEPGDTIEIHYVHSTDPIEPGPTLGSCLASDDSAPQLRVEAQVFVLVNDDSAADLVELTEVGEVDGLFQAVNIPNDTGTPVRYAGSTTGPSYNEKGSPFMVSWAVRPDVMKVSISSVEAWLSDNVFDEEYAHAVRNLVINEDLLAPIDG
ncbi:MAG: delta-class carbonic anhydrase [Actinomycetota bacterium]